MEGVKGGLEGGCCGFSALFSGDGDGIDTDSREFEGDIAGWARVGSGSVEENSEGLFVVCA